MDIKITLLAPGKESKKIAVEVAKYAASSKSTFDQLVECFLSDDHTLARRAAHSLSLASLERPDLIAPYRCILVKQLSRSDVHDAVIRNSARILQKTEIPEEAQGEALESCFEIIQNTEVAVAIRAFCMTILFNLTKIYPELKSDLRHIIRDRLPYEAPAFQSRGKKILALISGK